MQPATTLSAAAPTHIHARNLSSSDLKVIGSMAEEIVRKMTAEDRASSHRPHMGAHLVAAMLECIVWYYP